MLKGSRHSEESRMKVSDSLKRLYQTPRGKRIRGEIDALNRGNKHHLGHRHSPEAIEKMRAIKIGKVFSEETREKMRQAQLGHKGYWCGKEHNLETRMKMSRSQRAINRNLEYKARRIRNSILAQNIHPNKPETLVMNILNDIDPNNWKFTGNGDIIMGGKNPDFYNTNGYKKVIEVFGDYWHGKKARCYEETEEGRIEHFRKYGHKCLVIWERELKDVETLKDKIKEFVEV